MGSNDLIVFDLYSFWLLTEGRILYFLLENNILFYFTPTFFSNFTEIEESYKSFNFLSSLVDFCFLGNSCRLILFKDSSIATILWEILIFSKGCFLIFYLKSFPWSFFFKICRNLMDIKFEVFLSRDFPSFSFPLLLLFGVSFFNETTVFMH